MTTMRDLMMIVEEANTAAVEWLYHLTDDENVDAILADGFEPGSYFGSLAIIRFYIKMKLHRGQHPVIFRVPLSRFETSHLEPDLKGIEDPPSSDVIEMTGDDVEQAWDNSAQDWKTSLELIGSVRYEQRLIVSSDDIFEGRAKLPKTTMQKKPKQLKNPREEILRLALKHHADKLPSEIRKRVAELDDNDLPSVLATYRNLTGG